MAHLMPHIPDFDPALAEAIVYALCGGDSLLDACEAEGMPAAQAVSAWALADPEFARRLDAARRQGTMLRADHTVARCEGKHLPEDHRPRTHAEEVTRDRLAFAANRWLLACYNPEVFGRVSARHAAEKAAGDAVREQDLAREAAVLEARAQAKADHQILVDEVVWAKRNGTCAEASLELAGCILPLTRYVTEGCRRFNADALNRDFCTRRMVAGLLLGAPPRWGEFSANRFDPDLFAAMTAVRKEGDGPITLPPGPLPGGERAKVEPEADDEPAVDDAVEDDEDIDPRFAAVEAAFNGPPAPASPGYYSAPAPCGVVITDYDIHADLKGWNNSS